MEKRFYVCKHCGNMVGMIKNAGVPIICCGEPMAELTANTVEASQEKHLPVYTMEGGVLATNRQQNLLLQAAINLLQFTLTATCTACGKPK